MVILSPADSTSAASDTSSSQWQPSTHPRGKPRQKRYHSKSRNGCLTCRRRRIKCDEKRPACIACLRSNQECVYPNPSNDLPIVLYQPPSALLPPHLTASNLDFFLQNGVDFLSLVPGSLVCRTLSNDCHARFAKFWKSYVVSVAYSEPLILDLISMFSKRHRLALTTSQSDGTGYVRMLRIMSKLVESAQPDMVVVGAMIFFVYERLHSAATGEEPADQSHIHYDAIMRLLPKSSLDMVHYIMPVLGVVWKLMLQCTKLCERYPAQVPDRFIDCDHAITCFSEILQSSEMRPALRKWSTVALQYYEEVRGRNWEESKQVLTMLGEAQLLRTALDLTTEKQRTPGLLSPQNAAYLINTAPDMLQVEPTFMAKNPSIVFDSISSVSCSEPPTGKTSFTIPPNLRTAAKVKKSMVITET